MAKGDNVQRICRWTKGFKIRIPLDQYAEFGAFGFTSKAKASNKNRSLQQQTHDAIPCPDRKVRPTSGCVHPAEGDMRLPDNIRDGHYLHNRHFCAVLGCENAPYTEIKNLFSKTGELIIPFPILCKGKRERIEEIISLDPLLRNRDYTILNVGVKSLYDAFKADQNKLLYGDSWKSSGYPITEIMQGIAFVLAKDDELRGSRPKGNYLTLIERHISDALDVSIEIRRPDLLTPLVIVGNGRGALVGARNPNVYKKLISVSPDNEYKLCVRKITEEDLRNDA